MSCCLNRFFVYLNDIAIYNDTLDDHEKLLRLVFVRLRKHEIYVKKQKCKFCCLDVMFLGHWVSQGQIRMDNRKVKTIME